MNLIKGSLQDELDAFFQVLNDNPLSRESVTKAAFTKARRYLSHTAFVALRDDMNERIYENSTVAKWKGHRVFAVDGSKINLPNTPDIMENFDAQVSQNGSYPQALLSQCYDVLNGFTLDVQIAPFRSSERNLAEKHLEKTLPNDVLIYDRGYPAYWLYALHEQRNQYFVIRMKTKSKLSYLKEFIEDETLMDKEVIVHADKTAIKTCPEKGIQAIPLKLRMVKVVLPNGELEVLITNLTDIKIYPINEFQKLYAKRWSVEEDYKTQKIRLVIEGFSGKTIESIHQDIHAKVLTKNLAILCSLPANEIAREACSKRKHDYKINLTQALSKMKHQVVRLLSSPTPKLWIDELIYWFSSRVEPIREQRSYPRKHKKRSRAKTRNAYKPTR